jgi:hypothetical protein
MIKFLGFVGSGFGIWVFGLVVRDKLDNTSTAKLVLQIQKVNKNTFFIVLQVQRPPLSYFYIQISKN